MLERLIFTAEEYVAPTAEMLRFATMSDILGVSDEEANDVDVNVDDLFGGLF